MCGDEHRKTKVTGYDGMGWCGKVLYGVGWCDTMVWYGIVLCYGAVWWLVWYGIVWYDLVVWYGMV